MSCSHAEAVARYRQDLARPARQRLAEFQCDCGARIGRDQARAFYFTWLEREKHSRHQTHGVYPADLETPRRIHQR